MKFKKIVKYLVLLLPWFVSSVFFKIDTNYYKELSLPFFAPGAIVFPIVWSVLYVLIAWCLYRTSEVDYFDYRISWLINYISNQLFVVFFFVFKNNFVSFLDCLVVLISSVYILVRIRKRDAWASWLLVPYIIWNGFASVLALFIWLMNR